MTVHSLGGGGGAVVSGPDRISELLDVDLSGLADGTVFAYDASLSKWVPSNPLVAALQGQVGRNYRIACCALRNAGSPNYFQPISDSNHRSTNIDSVATSTTGITVHYESIPQIFVGSSIATADEALTTADYTVGASVGIGNSVLTIAKNGVLINPQTVTTTLVPNSNIWFFAIVEV